MIRTTARVAGKRHSCRRCWSTISVGEIYLSSVAAPGHGDLGNIGWIRSRECADCAFRCGRGLWLRAAS